MNYRSQFEAFLIGTALAIGAYVIGNIVVALSVLALQGVGIPAVENEALRVGVGTVMLQGVAFGGTALGYLYWSDYDLSFIDVRIPTIRDILVGVGGVIAVFAILFLASYLISALGIQSAENQLMEIGQESPIVFLLLVPLSYLLVGPGEELLYRGTIQGLFDEEFHSTRAIVLASALFAVIHIGSLQGSGKLVYVGLVFVLAIILGVVYKYTENIVVPAFVHGTYNAVQFGYSYLAATGALGG